MPFPRWSAFNETPLRPLKINPTPIVQHLHSYTYCKKKNYFIYGVAKKSKLKIY